MGIRDIRKNLAPGLLLGLLGLGSAFLSYDLGKGFYRWFQVSNAPIYVKYTLPEGRTWSREDPYYPLGVMAYGGLFDRDNDGTYDEVIEIGSVAWRLGGMPTSRVLHPSDEKFQERLELIQRKSMLKKK